MKREPLITVATITGAVTAILALLVAFGVDFTDDQQAAILGVGAVIAPFVVAAFARPKVTPTPKTPPPTGTRRREHGVITPLVGIVIAAVLLIVAGLIFNANAVLWLGVALAVVAGVILIATRARL